MALHRSLILSRGGFTLAEALVAMAIFTVAVLPLVDYVMGTSRHAAREAGKLESNDALRRAMSEAERDFSDTNEVTVSSETFISFRMDSSRAPGYNRNAASPADAALSRELNPDDDGDMDTLEPPAQVFRRTGDDLHDDDDDNDGRVDVECRYFLLGGSLIREFRVNEGPWFQRVVAERLTGLKFAYRGSREERAELDAGADGISGTADVGEGDGIVTDVEIDARSGLGNKNGRLDTFDERQALSSVELWMAHDANGDKKPDAEIGMEFSPVFLPLKRLN
jgi:hypothetical protein